MLDQELNRLPRKYRAPLILCYLKGHTHDQAAEELECPVGTVRSRLARGRDLLRRRLTSRGHAPTAAILGAEAGLPARLLTEAVPPSLVSATVEAALGIGASKTIQAGAASASALALTQGVLTTMKLAQLKLIGAGDPGNQPVGRRRCRRLLCREPRARRMLRMRHGVGGELPPVRKKRRIARTSRRDVVNRPSVRRTTQGSGKEARRAPEPVDSRPHQPGTRRRTQTTRFERRLQPQLKPDADARNDRRSATHRSIQELEVELKLAMATMTSEREQLFKRACDLDRRTGTSPRQGPAHQGHAGRTR